MGTEIIESPGGDEVPQHSSAKKCSPKSRVAYWHHRSPGFPLHNPALVAEGVLARDSTAYDRRLSSQSPCSASKSHEKGCEEYCQGLFQQVSFSTMTNISEN